MASDLAAFVTLKQLRSGQAAVLQQGRRVLSQSSAGGCMSLTIALLVKMQTMYITTQLCFLG